MSTKRIKLPSADDVLVRGHAPVADEPKSIKAPKKKGAKVLQRKEDEPREHISTYLRRDVIVQIEQARVQLLSKRKKLSKSELIERAIRLGLRNLDDVARLG